MCEGGHTCKELASAHFAISVGFDVQPEDRLGYIASNVNVTISEGIVKTESDSIYALLPIQQVMACIRRCHATFLPLDLGADHETSNGKTSQERIP
jgi:hypothetical protein